MNSWLRTNLRKLVSAAGIGVLATVIGVSAGVIAAWLAWQQLNLSAKAEIQHGQEQEAIVSLWIKQLETSREELNELKQQTATLRELSRVESLLIDRLNEQEELEAITPEPGPEATAHAERLAELQNEIDALEERREALLAEVGLGGEASEPGGLAQQPPYASTSTQAQTASAATPTQSQSLSAPTSTAAVTTVTAIPPIPVARPSQLPIAPGGSGSISAPNPTAPNTNPPESSTDSIPAESNPRPTATELEGGAQDNPDPTISATTLTATPTVTPTVPFTPTSSATVAATSTVMPITSPTETPTVTPVVIVEPSPGSATPTTEPYPGPATPTTEPSPRITLTPMPPQPTADSPVSTITPEPSSQTVVSATPVQSTPEPVIPSATPGSYPSP